MTLNLKTKNNDAHRDSRYSAEIELLIALSRVHLDEATLHRIQNIRNQPLDWSYLLNIAEQHKLTQMVAWHAQNTAAFNLPQDISAALKIVFEQNLQQNLHLLIELLKIVKLFEKNNIPTLVFKGPCLAKAMYGGMGLRKFVDLDLLIPEKCVVQASELLISQRYQSQFVLTKPQQITYAKLRNEHCFWDDEKQVNIDLHWSILPKHYSFTPNAQTLWESSIKVDFASQSVQTLKPEYLILFLCAHGAKHNWSKLSLICDVRQVIETYKTLDWQEIQAHAGQICTKKMLLLGLYLCHNLFQTDLPKDILSQLQSNLEMIELGTQVKHNLFNESSELNLFDKEPDFIYLQTMDLYRDKLWYWFDTIFTPTPLEWEIISLPLKLFFIYYFIRVARLLYKFFSTRIKRFQPSLSA